MKVGFCQVASVREKSEAATACRAGAALARWIGGRAAHPRGAAVAGAEAGAVGAEAGAADAAVACAADVPRSRSRIPIVVRIPPRYRSAAARVTSVAICSA